MALRIEALFGLPSLLILAACASDARIERRSTEWDGLEPLDKIEQDGPWIRPRVEGPSARDASRGAEVLLPARATGAFRVTDRGTAVSIDVTPLGTTDVPGELTSDRVVYRKALGGRDDLRHLVTREGTEDSAVLDAPPAVPELRYAVHLGEAVAGLRLVANTLEFLDAEGAPRLRVAPPYVVGADGVRQDARLFVEGCAFDSSPAAPWGRRPTDPGRSVCAVAVGWGSGLPYPLLVDPLWQATGNMSVSRSMHTATIFSGGPLDGKVLVAGGMNSTCSQPNVCSIGPVSSTEVYDPDSGTWAATGSMNLVRSQHTATLLNTGKVLAVGPGGSPELYDAATGTWTFGSPLAFGEERFAHTASLLQDGRVFIAGGNNGTVLMPYLRFGTDFYDPASDTWSPGPALTRARIGHTAIVLMDGTVLIAGGTGGQTPTAAKVLGDVEIVAPAAPFSMPTASMSMPRSGHRAILLPDGTILVVGGGDPSFERYSPKSATWAPAGALVNDRARFTMDLLGNGGVLVAGGEIGAIFPSTELYDRTTEHSTVTDSLVTPRSLHTSTLLHDGTLLVAGGYKGNSASDQLTSSEIFTLSSAGMPCSEGQACTSGFCADGVCCDKGCNGPCRACSGAKGASHDGICEPVKLGTACGAPACAADTLTEARCDGAGECVDATQSCAPYICAGTQARCADACTSVDQCAPPNVCDWAGKCIVPPQLPPLAGGCVCRTSEAGVSDQDTPAVTLLSVALLLAGAGRRRTRSPRTRPAWCN
jgi:hypothetical protein